MPNKERVQKEQTNKLAAAAQKCVKINRFFPKKPRLASHEINDGSETINNEEGNSFTETNFQSSQSQPNETG